jgi:hypothetical protein
VQRAKESFRYAKSTAQIRAPHQPSQRVRHDAQRERRPHRQKALRVAFLRGDLREQRQDDVDQVVQARRERC